MLPLISIPTIVEHYAPNFKSLFSEADYEHLKKYVSGLLVCENKTVEAINRLFVTAPQNQSTLNRFLTASAYDLAALNQNRLDWLNSQPATQLKSKGAYGGVLGLDDTLLCHHGKSFEHIAKLKDHVTGRYVWAHNLVNLHYSDDQTDYPTYFQLWKPIQTDDLETGLRQLDIKIKDSKVTLKQEAPKKWRNHLKYLYQKHQDREQVQAIYKTKIHIGRDLLQQFYEQYPDANIPVSFDKWFTCPAFCKFIDQDLKQAYVAGLKSNEKIFKKGSQTISVGAFVDKVKTEHLAHKDKNGKSVFTKTTIKYKGKKEVFYTYCKTHNICGLGKHKLLISYQKQDLSDGARVYICNRLTWRVQQITRVGRHRWPVEEYHKEGKAEGLDQYQIRNFKGVQKHIALVALTYSLLKYAQHDQTFLDHLQAKLDTNIKATLPFWRRTIQAESLWLMIQWIQQYIQQGGSLEQVFHTLKPAFGIA